MWDVVLSDAAVAQLRRIPKAKRGIVSDGIRKHLADSNPMEETRNKFRLRRASEHAEYELRLEPWRVFYRVRENKVEVVMIGEKRGNVLLVAGKEFVI